MRGRNEMLLPLMVRTTPQTKLIRRHTRARPTVYVFRLKLLILRRFSINSAPDALPLIHAHLNNTQKIAT